MLPARFGATLEPASRDKLLERQPRLAVCLFFILSLSLARSLARSALAACFSLAAPLVFAFACNQLWFRQLDWRNRRSESLRLEARGKLAAKRTVERRS